MKLLVNLRVFMALFSAFSCTSTYALDGSVIQDENSQTYTIRWQSDQPVNLKVVGQRLEDKIIVIAQLVDSDTSMLTWHAPDNDRYSFVIEEQQGQTLTLRSRVLDLEGSRNFRELGGYPTTDGRSVKWGKLYRSGALHNLTEQDYAVLANLDIATVVDFRGNSERDNETTQWQAGDVNQMTWDYDLHFDTSAFKDMFAAGEVSEEDMEQVMASMYPGLLNQQKEHYKQMFNELKNSEQATLFHCTAGKDRTGVAAALILHTLGVEEEVIMQDYVMSESVLNLEDFMPALEEGEKPNPQFAMFAKMPKAALKALMGTRESYLNAAYAEMITQSGSVDAFIRDELDVNDEDIAILKAKYLN